MSLAVDDTGHTSRSTLTVRLLESVTKTSVEDGKILRDTLNAPLDVGTATTSVSVALEEKGGDEDDFPDGGLRAWLVVFGGVCTTLSSFGFVNSWGAFQSYYQQTLLQDSSASDIAWIGSIQYSLTFFPSLLTGRLFDLGHFKLPFFIASCLMVTATFLTAQCRVYWHFVLCQGIVVGLASGVIFGPTLAVISHWFKKRRGTALGIIACGSSIGGTVIPIVFRNLVFRIGFPWTMRVIGFMLMCTLSVANLTLTRRLPPVNLPGGLLNIKAFKSMPYSVYTISGFVAFLGLYTGMYLKPTSDHPSLIVIITVLTYIDVSAASNGVPDSFSFYLVSIANASSFFGRIGAGLLSDMIGPINVMTPFTLLAGVLTYIWPFVHGQTSYIVVAIVYGFSSGAYVSLLVAPMIALGETGDVGRRSGMYMSVLASGALAGPPISGAINGATNGYAAVGVYAGSMVIVSVGLMWAARCMVLGQLRGKF